MLSTEVGALVGVMVDSDQPKMKGQTVFTFLQDEKQKYNAVENMARMLDALIKIFK